jgi:hypothetical protein
MSYLSSSSRSSSLIVISDHEEEKVESSNKRQKVSTSIKISTVEVKTKKESPLKGTTRMSKVDSIQRYRRLSNSIVTKKWNESIFPTLNRIRHGDMECWQSSLASQGSGYCQIQLNGSGYGDTKGYYLCHLWSMRYHNRIPDSLPYLDPDCSHRCHNKRCCNPDHLIFEEGRNNKRRNVCPFKVHGTLICPFIHDGPACLTAHSDFEENGKRTFEGYD